MNNLELIDCERKGNLIRLYFGKNGEQTGDDWDDIPYEYNAGVVYFEFVKGIMDIAIDFNFDVLEPADVTDLDYCRNNFISGKIYAFKVWERDGEEIMQVFFGDTLQDILYNFQMAKVNIHIMETFICNRWKTYPMKT